jgi:tetratricopeptide (TPR) repeat protein
MEIAGIKKSPHPDPLPVWTGRGRKIKNDVKMHPPGARLSDFAEAGVIRSGRRWVISEHFRMPIAAFAIAVLVLAIYLPILPGNFVMDDQRLVTTANPLSTGELSPVSVWFQSDFPLTELVWRGEWLLWGGNPAGYHAVNLILHALGAILLWRVLVQLKIPGGWMAAAIFAAHPVCVNSVARIAELKNTLSMPFFFASFWAYLRYEQAADPQHESAARAPRALWLAASLMAFVLALFAKTSAVMLPVLLLACALWQRKRIAARDWVQTSPYFVLAAGFGLMSIWFQKNQALGGEGVAGSGALDRMAVAGRALWFYAGKAVWPSHLTVFYPRWPKTAPALELVPVAAAGLLLLLAWRRRTAWGRHVLFGFGGFAAMLFPVLGIFDGQCFTKFQVSDHLQYLPLTALTALVIAAAAFVLRDRVFRVAACAVLIVMSLLAHERARVFATGEELMRDTLAKDATAWPAENDLGVMLAQRNDLTGAATHFEASLRVNPENPEAQANLGRLLAMRGQFDEALGHYQIALRADPRNADVREGLATALQALGREREALVQLTLAAHFSAKVQARLGVAALHYRAGHFRAAAEAYRAALAKQPDTVEALNNLAWMLATCSDDTVRNGDEAVQLAERACRITEFKQSFVMSTLAAAYAEAGRFAEAISTAEAAMRLQLDAGEQRMAEMNRMLLVNYREGKAWRERR